MLSVGCLKGEASGWSHDARINICHGVVLGEGGRLPLNANLGVDVQGTKSSL